MTDYLKTSEPLEAVINEEEEQDQEDAEYCCRRLENLDLSKAIPWEDLKKKLGIE